MLCSKTYSTLSQRGPIDTALPSSVSPSHVRVMEKSDALAGKKPTCCFLVMSRSISSTSSTVTRLLSALLSSENILSRCSAAAAGEACLPVSACSQRGAYSQMDYLLWENVCIDRVPAGFGC